MFSAEETAFIDKILKSADAGDEQIIEGSTARKIFKASLPVDVLAQIWHLADRGDKGFLTSMDLGIALRLISHAQFGVQVHPRFMNIPVPPPTLPYYELNRRRSFTPKAPSRTRSATPTAGLSFAPDITREECAESARLFLDHNPVNGRVKGSRVRELFLHSGLPTETLYEIWDLVDLDYVGSLDLTQFILAMHFIREKTLRPTLKLPSAVTIALYNLALPSRPMPSSAKRPWIISPEDKRLADEQFDYWDPVCRGYLQRDLVLIILIGYARQLEMEEPEATAVQIWSLLDPEIPDQLDRDGFAVALKVLDDTAGMIPFPAALPKTYVPPNWRRKRHDGLKNPFTSMVDRERKLRRMSGLDADAIRTRNTRVVDIERAIREFRKEQEAQEQLRHEMAQEALEEAKRQREELEAARKARELAARKEREEVLRREREIARAKQERERVRQEKARREREARRRDSAPVEDEATRRSRSDQEEREEREAEAAQKAREERRAWARLEQNRWKDYYKILGVGREADEGEIKRAHRKESLRHHPDKGGDEDTFMLIQEAREVLCSPTLRGRYDALRGST
ncbi:DnaJ-domain-containing protein [Dacryopinax primogenitus]|uniref:DnaJ-domain-containing protein n=1 Tax=Dacryopinax primogenitus (strain DJM 731) TaxID=1858805 RepID=M5G7W8_DACPD|nr:DnaJ-domain-containing protein [Dacryopinax primogenitus]EJU06301.1 DnaJ-domain-containing protein [Dacryopinax primogenitus]